VTPARDVVVSTGRRGRGKRGQAAADVSTRHQRNAPVRGGQADLALARARVSHRMKNSVKIDALAMETEQPLS
jgi:hypothetical protein